MPNEGGGNQDDVVIHVPGTPTITAGGTIVVHGLSNSENLDITGSYFSPGLFRITGGGALVHTGTIELV